MNIDGVIALHLHWKRKLATYLAKPDDSMNPFDIAIDDRCALGKWLYGIENTGAGKDQYDEVLRRHAAFHKATAELVRRANAGHALSEEVVLKAFAECEEASTALVKALANLRRVLPNTELARESDGA